MLDIKWIRENPGALADALAKRGWSAEDCRATVDDLVARDEARRAHVSGLQTAQERRNAASREIGNAMRAGDSVLAEQLKSEIADIKGLIQGGEAVERELDAKLDAALAVIPNLPLEDVPEGLDESGNVELRAVGEKPAMAFEPKEHWEIGEALGLMDFERAAKMSGARFTVLKGKLARLERALGQFMLDLHTTEHGYTEVQPPLLVKDDALFGTNQLPKFEEDLFFTDPRTGGWAEGMENWLYTANKDRIAISEREYSANEVRRFLEITARGAAEVFGLVNAESVLEFRGTSSDDGKGLKLAQRRLGLIPTSEVPLTNLVREEITPHDRLPLRFTALTPCFRSEAGSAGRDTRGMLRQHQFYKVELVSITDADSSLAEHERMTACAEEVLKRLGLPFRTVVLCAGDMGFGARKTHDIEVWLPGQNAYREISSCSVCGDFQARRMDARYKSTTEKATRFVHTLNGSGVAVGRALIAVIENYQNADGSITVPDVLRPYMGGLDRIEA